MCVCVCVCVCACVCVCVCLFICVCTDVKKKRSSVVAIFILKGLRSKNCITNENHHLLPICNKIAEKKPIEANISNTI